MKNNRSPRVSIFTHVPYLYKILLGLFGEGSKGNLVLDWHHFYKYKIILKQIFFKKRIMNRGTKVDLEKTTK